MAGLLLLWLVMEEVCDLTSGSHVALFSDNAPTVSWVNKLASKNSQVADQLIRALALRLKLKGASPLSTMHIAGDKNEMTDIPSRSFGSEAKWFCCEDKNESDLFELYHSQFPLPKQNCWTLYHLPREICTRVISVLLTQASVPQEWRRPFSKRTSISTRGVPMSNLWEWTLGCRNKTTSTCNKSEPSRDLGQE